jgi:SPP1 gp7 family putative phage head morphogenesis protein
MSSITKDQQAFIDLTLEFTKLIYEQCEKNINPIYSLQIKNRNTLLDKIAKILLSYNISDNVLDLTSIEKKKIFSNLSETINSMIKDELKFETRTAREIIKQAILDKFNTNNYIYSLGIDFTLTQLPSKDLDKIINAKIQGENWSRRIWTNKNELSKDLGKQVKDFLNGKTNVNQIEKVIKTKYNVNATNANRLINTEICRVQEESNEVWADKHDIKQVMWLATLDSHVCGECASLDGKVFNVDDVNRPIPPLHPGDRCCLISLVSKDFKPQMRYDNELKKNVNWQSYSEWKNAKSIN